MIFGASVNGEYCLSSFKEVVHKKVEWLWVISKNKSDVRHLLYARAHTHTPLGLNTRYTYNLAVMSSMRATTVDLVSFFSCPTMVRPR